MNQIREANTVDIIEGKSVSPKVQITGLRKGLTDEEIKAILRDENEDLESELGPDWPEKLNIITRRECRNKYKQNIIISTETEIFKVLMKKNKIRFDLLMLFV